MNADIFISFASQDRKVASTLCAALETRGIRCWISTRDILPGENFQIAIVQAIRRSKIMLLVFTANSNNSQEMTKELALASQNKLIVVPLRIEDVTPNDAFAYEFATRQWIDFFADWEFAVQQLSQRIENALGEVAAPEPAAPAAKPVSAAPAPPPVAALAEAPADPPRRKASPKPSKPELAAGEPAEPATAAEARSFAPDTVDLEPPLEGEPRHQPARARMFVALGVLALLAVGLSVATPGLFRKKPASAAPQPIAMSVLQPAAPAAAPPVATDPAAAADASATNAVATAEEAPAAKALVRKKKPKAVQAAHQEEVPY